MSNGKATHNGNFRRFFSRRGPMQIVEYGQNCRADLRQFV